MATATVEPSKPTEALAATGATPSELLRIAVSQGADMEKLEKLMNLQERWERNEARKAFVVAMNQFKADPPAITKNKEVSFGNTRYSHATLDHVCSAVIGGLSKFGISHRWKVEQNNEWIKVTCILTHELGHSEETTLQGCADNSGSKNSIQAVGSTVTYLQRYTLLAATGLAAGGTDTDGRTPSETPKMNPTRLVEICEWMENASSMDELQKLYRTAYREANDAGDKAAQAQIIRKKDEQKRRFL